MNVLGPWQQRSPGADAAQVGDSVVFDTDVGMLVTTVVRCRALEAGDVVVVPTERQVVTQEYVDGLDERGMDLDLQQVTKPYGVYDESLPYGRDRDDSHSCLFVRSLERPHEWVDDGDGGYWADEGCWSHGAGILFHKVVRTDNPALVDAIVAGRLAWQGHRAPADLLLTDYDVA